MINCTLNEFLRLIWLKSSMDGSDDSILMVVVVMMLVEGGRCNAMLIENRGQAYLASGLSPMHTDSLPRL